MPFLTVFFFSSNRVDVAICPLPRSGRIFWRMLPNWHPIGGCLLHREFGNGATGPGFFTPHPAQRFFIVPRLYPALFRARMISDFRGASDERGRAAMVLPQRRGMERDCRAAQADAVSALQGCRRADSPRLSARIRRAQLPAKNGSRSADLLQQSHRASRVRADFQRLGRGQSPTAQPDNPRSVAVPPTRRRRQHRRCDPRRRRLPAK